MRTRIAFLLCLLTVLAVAQVLPTSRRIAAPTPAASGGITYLFLETFDGAGTDNTWQGALPLDYDYTTAPAPLKGAQSAEGNTDEVSYSEDFTPVASGYLAFRLRVDDTSTASDYPCGGYDTAGTFLFRFSIRSDGTARLYGQGATTVTGLTLPTDEDVAVKMRFAKGTGANAEAEIWIATIASGAWGASDGSFSDGDWTADCGRITLEGQTMVSGVLILDQIILDDDDIPFSALQ